METREILDTGLRPFEYWSTRSLKMLTAWENGDDIAGYRTGLAALDNFIRLVPTEVTILGARPGMGKTALAVQIAMNCLPNPDAKDRVAIFSAEMAGWSLNLRIACAVAGVPMFDLRSRQADAIAYETTRLAIQRIASLPILVDDSSRPSTDYMASEIEMMADEYDVRLLIFDFMELAGDAGRTQEERLSNAMNNLKGIAKRFEIPVLALSHLSREVESRADKIPQLDDLRYSGMIEQLADQVILMTRPKYYLDKGVPIKLESYNSLVDGGAYSNVADIAYMFVAKNRNGNTGIARLGFDGPGMRFFDLQRVQLNRGLT